MKKGLLGSVNNVSANINKIKVWANSFKKFSDGEVVLCVTNGTDEEHKLLEDMGITVSPYVYEGIETINNVRLHQQILTLKKQDWDYVLITDVFDVVFQKDPFEKFIDGPTDLVLGNEGIKHNEEPWNLDVMKKSYPQHVDLVRDKYIYCSGVMGGTRDTMIDLLTMMEVITMSGVKGHDIRDQAALNILIYDNPPWNIVGFLPNSGWVLHCALGGPTQFYESWGFKRLFEQRWGEAKLLDGKIVTADDKPYDIVHQFNRIPEWNEILTAPYV